MKYKLETIPVHRAYESEADCPLCFLHGEAEKRYVEFYLGPSVMAPETRIKVNEHGFCRRHFSMMLASGNRLSIALMLRTHMDDIIRAASADFEKLTRASSPKKAAAAFSGRLRQRLESCLICSGISDTMNDYVYTLVHLWSHENEFREMYGASKGFCLPHLSEAAAAAADGLNKQQFREWAAATAGLQKAAAEVLRRELKSFTSGYDYQADRTVAESSRNAVPQSIDKISGPP